MDTSDGEEKFGGDAKVGKSLIHKWERGFIDWMVPRLPSWLRSYHLTLMTIPISGFIVVFSFMALFNVAWLWVVSLLIATQWLTDSLDGSLGRYRKEGLVRWGYYMDHLLDYFFFAAVMIGYTLLLPDRFLYVQFFVFVVLTAFMVNSFLSFAASNAFRISYWGVGPTEIRIVFILLNTLLILFGRTFMAGLLPYFLILAFIGLCVVVYRTQREVWDMDQVAKGG